jgi:hypothetical protein
VSTCPPLLREFNPAKNYRLTILAINRAGDLISPKTKKNSPMIVPGVRHPILLPSEAYREWERFALESLKKAGIVEPVMMGRKANGKPDVRLRWTVAEAIDYPVNCCALVYRDARVGDCCGYYQAIGDMLQAAGIVADDRWISSWDGSRLLKDAARPRIEIALTEVV